MYIWEKMWVNGSGRRIILQYNEQGTSFRQFLEYLFLWSQLVGMCKRNFQKNFFFVEIYYREFSDAIKYLQVVKLYISLLASSHVIDPAKH